MSDEDVLHQLYRHWDKDKRLLYVGISLSAVGRLAEHRRNALWYKDISNVTIENFPTRELLIKAEKRAIIRENPIHNLVHAVKIRKEPIEDDSDVTSIDSEYLLDVYNIDEDEYHFDIRDCFEIDQDQRERLGLPMRDSDDSTLDPDDAERARLMDGQTRPEDRDMRVLGLLLYNQESGEGATVLLGNMSHSASDFSPLFRADVLADCIDDLNRHVNTSSREWRRDIKSMRRDA